MIEFKPNPRVDMLKPIKCNCQEIDESLCDKLLEGIRRELEANRPSDFKIHNIKRMIEDFNH